MKIFTKLRCFGVAAMTLLVLTAPITANAQSASGGRYAPLDASGQVSRNVIPSQLVPVCNNAQVMGNNNLGSIGYQMHSISWHYCGGGFKGGLTALFNGFWMPGTTEQDLTSPITFNVGVQVAPAGTKLWNPNDTFAAGAYVIWGNSLWVAASGSTGQMPSPSNTTYWTAYTGSITPMTCEGRRGCTVTTQLNAAGFAALNGVGPYNPLLNYAVGDKVYVLTGSSIQMYQAAAAQTGVASQATNASLVPAVYPNTATAAGTTSYPSPYNTNNWTLINTIAVGTIGSDAVAGASCTSACFVAFYVYGVSPGQIPIGNPGRADFGETWSQGATVTDLSLTGTYDSPPKSPTGIFRPAAILGIPNDNTRNSVVILGDSIGSGASGHNLIWSTTPTAGGSGYTSADIGKICAITTTGAGTYAVAGGLDRFGLPYGAAKSVITAVSGGAITAQEIFDAGTMTTPSANPSGGALPTGTQTISQTCYPSATVGSGATVSTSEGAGWDLGDDFDGKGFVQRGLDTLGIPWVLVGRSSDTASEYYTGRSYARMSFVSKLNAKSAIIQLKVNDLGLGTSAVTGYLTRMANDLKQRGVRFVYLTTMSPYTTSSDGFLTTANQTPNGSSTTLIAVNQWIKANGNAAPFDGYFDTGAAIMSATDSGLTAPPPDGATVCWFQCEGLHPTSRGSAAMALAISNNPGIFKQ